MPRQYRPGRGDVYWRRRVIALAGGIAVLGLVVWTVNGTLGGSGTSQSANVTFTVAQVALFFSIYVFFQVWNQINCRALTPGHSGLHRILRNPTFLAIAGVTALGQILIVTFGGRIFNVEPLGGNQWIHDQLFL